MIEIKDDSYGVPAALIKTWRKNHVRLTSDIEKGEKKIAELKDKRDHFAKLIQAAEPLSFTEKPTQTRKRGRTWTSVMEEILENADRGMFYEEVKAEIMHTAVGKKLQKSDKGFYGAIIKLEDRNKIVKHNGKLYSLAAHRKFMADVKAGRVKDEIFKLPTNRSPVGDKIKKILSEKSDGMTSKEIRILIEQMPEFQKSMKNHSFLYNVLARLMEKNEITKEGNMYRLTLSSVSDLVLNGESEKRPVALATPPASENGNAIPSTSSLRLAHRGV